MRNVKPNMAYYNHALGSDAMSNEQLSALEDQRDKATDNDEHKDGGEQLATGRAIVSNEDQRDKATDNDEHKDSGQKKRKAGDQKPVNSGNKKQQEHLLCFLIVS